MSKVTLTTLVVDTLNREGSRFDAMTSDLDHLTDALNRLHFVRSHGVEMAKTMLKDAQDELRSQIGYQEERLQAAHDDVEAMKKTVEAMEQACLEANPVV